MIVVDSSALVAILCDEAEAPAFRDIITQSYRCVASALNIHETAIVMRMRGGLIAIEKMWELLVETETEIIAFDEIHVRAAIAAFNTYGKGIHSKARLNLADCAAYALASSLNAPLLFKGDDFAATDITSAI